MTSHSSAYAPGGDAARATARMLLEIGAVDIRAVNAPVDAKVEGPETSVRPYTLTSGLASPC
ncbi:MAG: hypothetical protein AAFU72_11190, partial [Pseudomonadota bacterium]